MGLIDMVGTWQRLAHVPLTSAGDTINTGDFEAKENLRIIFSGVGTNASSYPRLRFNGTGDSDNDYAYRQSMDGATDATPQVNQNHINTTGNVGAFHHYFVADVTNIDGKEKLVIVQGMDANTAGADNVPRRREVAGKWDITSGQITSVQITDLGNHNFASGAYITVFGATGDIITDEKTTLTNVPANSRYEETDTRKIFRRTAESTTSEQDLFNSSFTTSGNASQTTATDTTGKVVMTQSGGSGNNAKAYRTLSNSYNSKTFTIDFTFKRNSGDNANNSGVSFGSDNTADGNISGNAKRLMFAFENGSYIRVKVETVATNNTFTDTTSFQATGTTKYYRFVGNGSNVVLTMFPTLSDRTNGTNADRTYQSVDFPSDWLTTDSIDTFTLEGWSGYHAGNWEVSDVEISFTSAPEWKERNTA